MRTFELLAIAVLRPLAIGIATLLKAVIVFHWTTPRDIALAIIDECRAATNAEPDDWRR